MEEASLIHVFPARSRAFSHCARDAAEMSSEEDASFDCSICLVRLTCHHTRTFDHFAETLCQISIWHDLIHPCLHLFWEKSWNNLIIAAQHTLRRDKVLHLTTIALLILKTFTFVLHSFRWGLAGRRHRSQGKHLSVSQRSSILQNMLPQDWRGAQAVLCLFTDHG